MPKFAQDTENDGDEELDFNVASTASNGEVEEFEKELGGGEAEKPAVEEDHEEELDDEETSAAKTSEEESEAATDADKQNVRERKKQERLNQRQRMKARQETLERQLANSLAANQAMQQRISALENSNLGTQAAQLDRAAQEAEQAETFYKNNLADATVKQDGTRAAEATQGLIEMRARKEMIANAKASLDQQAKAPRAQPLDTEVVNHAKAFMNEHPWFKPRSDDMDSRILSMIDDKMTQEGWNPRSPSYWAELRSRAAEKLPNRFKSQPSTESKEDGYNASSEKRPQRSPVAGSSSNSGGEKSTKFTLSPERVRAIKESGDWDDPVQRASAVKYYQDFDRLAKQRN